MNKRILFISILSLVIDQLSKIAISIYLKEGSIIKIIGNFFYLTKVFNTGAAFSILEGQQILLIMLSIIILGILYKYIKQVKETFLTNISFGLIIGGILGNLIDRIALGYVRDFLKFNIFGYNFPIFNIADSAIVIGVLLLIIYLERNEVNVSNSKR